MRRVMLILFILVLFLSSANGEEYLFYQVPFGTNVSNFKLLFPDSDDIDFDTSYESDHWLTVNNPNQYPILGFTPRSISAYFLNDSLVSVIATLYSEHHNDVDNSSITVSIIF